MAESEFQVTHVTADTDRHRSYRLRYKVFVEEQAKSVAAADHERKIIKDELDDLAEHFAVFHKGEMVASMRILYGAEKLTPFVANSYSIDRFSHIPADRLSFCGRLFVLPAYRNSAALFLLVQHAYRASRERGTQIDVICCRPNLVRLYEQLGYRRYRPHFEDHAGQGFLIPLVLILDDLEYLKTVRSPLYLSARKLPSDPSLAQWFKQAFPDYRSFVSPITVGADRFMEIMSGKINDSEVGMLRGMTEAERQALYASTTHLEIAAGTKLIRKGDGGKELFLILDGVAEARLPNTGGEVVLATHGRGDITGEMSLLTGRPRSADVVATTGLEVICFDDDGLRKLMKGQPAVAAKLLHNLSRILAERLEITSSQLATAIRSNEVQASGFTAGPTAA